MSASKPMPVLYIPHGGGPWPFMTWDPPNLWDDLRGYLSGIDAALGRRPKAILMISAHWEERTFTLQTTPRPALDYDYSGFPPETYRLQYPAVTSPALAARTEALLRSSGIDVKTDDKRAFDHGAFVPLMVMYPKADVPVLQMSLRRRLDPTVHLEAGRALQALRHEDVLIVASGMSYHNLARFGEPQGAEESVLFEAWLKQTVENPDAAARDEALRTWDEAPAARAVHPREEHLLPLMIAAGAAGADVGRQTFSGLFFGCAYSGYQFG